MNKVYIISNASNCSDAENINAKIALSGKEAMNMFWQRAQDDINSFIRKVMNDPEYYDADHISVNISSKEYCLNAEAVPNSLFCTGKMEQVDLDAIGKAENAPITNDSAAVNEDS